MVGRWEDAPGLNSLPNAVKAVLLNDEDLAQVVCPLAVRDAVNPFKEPDVGGQWVGAPKSVEN